MESSSSLDRYRRVSEIDRRRMHLDEMAKHSSVLYCLALNCLQDNPKQRPAASLICNELQSYIHHQEAESPNLAASCKQDKLTLVQSLKSY